VDTPSIRCAEFVELVTDWMEGGLAEPVRTEIEEHLLICPPCVLYVNQITSAVRALRAAEPPSAPVLRRDELLDAFRASQR
jgi:predicted anti-sigma-YlaC factor YlaD